MNKFLKHISFTLFFAIVLFGCTKPEEPENVYKGTANALRNGVSWSAECTAFHSLQYDNEVSLSIDRYNSIGENREHIAITRIPLTKGIYTIVSRVSDSLGQTITLYGSRYSSLTADGDAVDGVFHVLESGSNYIEITNIDLNTMDFAGKFSVTYIKDTNFTVNPDLPDTLRFKSGEFNTKIQDSW